METKRQRILRTLRNSESQFKKPSVLNIKSKLRRSGKKYFSVETKTLLCSGFFVIVDIKRKIERRPDIALPIVDFVTCEHGVARGQNGLCKSTRRPEIK